MIAAATLALALAGAPQPAPAPAQPPVIRWERNFEDALKKARKSGKPLIVDFWADWCGWCRRLDKTTYADPLVARKAQDFVAVKVNTEGSRKELDVARRYQVMSLPTILFLSPEGRQIGRVNGFQGPGQFPNTLDAALEGGRLLISWEDALARNPDDPRALAALGAHLYDQMYIDDARELLERAVARDADLPAADRRRSRMLLAIIENVQRNFVAAEKMVKDALALSPSEDDQPKLLFVLGRTYVQMGRHAEGVATMQIIVREYPQSPLAQKAKETLVNLERR